MTDQNLWVVYVILTDKGQYYTGITKDLSRRWQEHLAMSQGKKNSRGARFFRTQKPLSIHYKEVQPSRSEASKREAAIKKLSPEQKRNLKPLD